MAGYVSGQCIAMEQESPRAREVNTQHWYCPDHDTVHGHIIHNNQENSLEHS